MQDNGCLTQNEGEEERFTFLEYFMGTLLPAFHRDGEVTFKNVLSYRSSYFQIRNFGTLATSVTVTTNKIWLKKELSSRYSSKIMSN